MALKDLLRISTEKELQKIGLSEERVKAILPQARDYISFWREYPDMLVDFLCGGDEAKPNTLHLFYYQRLFLRAVMRHRQAYAVFPRAYSKSFLSVLVLMLRCVLYPGSNLFITTGGKNNCQLLKKFNKNIADKSWKAEKLIRVEGYIKYSQTQRIEDEKI